MLDEKTRSELRDLDYTDAAVRGTLQTQTQAGLQAMARAQQPLALDFWGYGGEPDRPMKPSPAPGRGPAASRTSPWYYTGCSTAGSSSYRSSPSAICSVQCAR